MGNKVKTIVEIKKTLSIENMRDHDRSINMEGYYFSSKLKKILNSQSIHNDYQEAYKYGFEAPIISGDLLYSVICEVLDNQYGERFSVNSVIEINFLKPIMVGDEFVIVFINRLFDQGGEVDILIKNCNDDVVLKGTMKLND